MPPLPQLLGAGVTDSVVASTGLSTGVAKARLALDGPNELPRAGRRSRLRIVGEVLREPMLALLLAGGFAYLLLGSLAEALILIAFATFSVAVTVIQESRTEHVLEALCDLSAPRALVIRDGVRVRIAGRDVVRGDILVLEQGDRVAADAVLREAADLQIDESLLTGESLSVNKASEGADAELGDHRAGGDGQPYVYSGTLVARGTGIGLVIATGAHSEIGKIGRSLAMLDSEAPRLRMETARIVRVCAIGGGLVAGLVVLLYGTLRGGWVDAVLAGIAIGMSMLPEEFPVVLTIFLAMGAWRIGQAGVLTRRAAAVETLGSATVLCTDKTGTLTVNQMAVAELWLPSGATTVLKAGAAAAAEFRPLLAAGVQASAPDPSDPMEVAIQLAGVALPASDGWSLAHSFGLRPDLLAVTNIWKTGADAFSVAAKGAPEAIADLCKLSAEEREGMVAAVDAMAARGIRVLGVAAGETTGTAWPDTPRDFAFSLIGLIGLADPLRPSVVDAVKQCRSAGIKVVMITGDYAATARAIASQAGIADGEVMTGAELASLDDIQLAERLPRVTVFARIMPEQKLRIVGAFKADGEVVAMTGDGVNDAPSLKAAHIGIAMGKRGTDVAREASAIVLLDDDFGAIVGAIGLGRRIYDNIRKAMAFIFAVHVPIAGLALLPLVLGLPILFGPVHIALLEMVIDPVCALVFEGERAEAHIMQRKPRPSTERLFTWRMIAWSVFQGGLTFVLLSGLFLIATARGMPESEVRALTFFALIAAIMALILINRSFSTSLLRALSSGNVALPYVFAAVASASAAILFIPPVQMLLHFEHLRPTDLLVAGAVGTMLLVALEVLKPLAKRAILDHAPMAHARPVLPASIAPCTSARRP
jgi:Ca2+-transporting ATPase